MFTGIIEEIGTLRSIERAGTSAKLSVQASKVLEGTQLGDSIAVNGVCLTVTSRESDRFTADIMPETLSRSSLGALHPGDGVNLERALAAGGRFGGHIVSGHIDGTGRIEALEPDGNAVWVSVRAAAGILRLIVPKGSIAIDGISLTVADVDGERFRVSLIPHTGAATTLLQRKPGDLVNLENDIIGKYVDKLFHAEPPMAAEAADAPGYSTEGGSGITMAFLEENGI